MLDWRHLDLMIDAFAEAAASFPSLGLVLAGQNRLRRPRDLERWIERSGVAERIQVLGYVDEDAVVALYRRVGEEGARRMARLDWTRSAELFLAEVERAVAS